MATTAIYWNFNMPTILDEPDVKELEEIEETNEDAVSEDDDLDLDEDEDDDLDLDDEEESDSLW